MDFSKQDIPIRWQRRAVQKRDVRLLAAQHRVFEFDFERADDLTGSVRHFFDLVGTARIAGYAVVGVKQLVAEFVDVFWLWHIRFSFICARLASMRGFGTAAVGIFTFDVWNIVRAA